ncbi:MAG TPA: hypothetical protein VG028_13470 [Terriglobia bacterium]|nr:hypothetical protein [Terriglobia bacterium]
MIATGIQNAFIQPKKWGRNESGNYEGYHFEGPALQIKNLAASFANLPGLLYEVTEGYGKWSLDVHFPWNADGLVNPATDTIETWEFFAQTTEKDLLNVQDNMGIIATLSQQEKEVIRNSIDNPPALSNGQPDITLATFQNLPDDTGNPENAYLVYQLMLAGEKSYPMPAPILRRNIVTSSQYALGYVLTNVRRLLSTNYVALNEYLPGNLLFNVSSYTANDVSTDPRLEYGWYKNFPTIQQAAMFKWRISQEYQYGWWPWQLFGHPL